MAQTEGSSVPSKKRKLSHTLESSTLVDTTVFVVGFSPYKATLRLPQWRRFSDTYIADAAAQQGIQPPKGLPNGKYEVLHLHDGHQVAVFKFQSTEGCRVTDSPQHSKLPIPTHRHRDIQDLMVEPNNLRVGCRYLYGYDHPYTVESKKIEFDQAVPTKKLPQESEISRTVDMIQALRSKYGDQCDIKVFADTNHYCPFSGGGDIRIFKKDSFTGAVLQGPEPQSEELELLDASLSLAEIPTSPQLDSQQQIAASLPESAPQCSAQKLQLTPPKQGECRCGAIENKVTHAQKETAVCMQLQANMMLLCSNLLVEKIKENKDPADITMLTCYGIQLGPTYALKILKLTIDFDKCVLLYEELFNLDQCVFYPAFIDISLFFVLENLK